MKKQLPLLIFLLASGVLSSIEVVVASVDTVATIIFGEEAKELCFSRGDGWCFAIIQNDSLLWYFSTNRELLVELAIEKEKEGKVVTNVTRSFNSNSDQYF